MATVFLSNDYLDGKIVKKGQVIKIIYLGELMKVRVMDILVDGVRVEIM